MKIKNIGFIGLGNIGSKLAKNLINSNFKLFIFDKNKKTYLKFKDNRINKCKSLKDLITQCDIFITCLPSPKSVNDVIFSIQPYMNKNHLWIEMSTTDKNEVIRLSKFIKKKGANIIECPITGGEHKAASGNISILAAGNKLIYKKVFPILSKLGYKILFCGKLGNASILKVITNYLASLNLIGIGEALAVAKKSGIDLGLTYNAIRISSGNSFVNETETQVILSGTYDVGFTMDLVNKDTKLFTNLGKELNIDIELGKVIKRKFISGMKILGKRSFSTSIVKLLEKENKIKMRAKNFPKKLIDKNPKKKSINVITIND